MNIYRPQPSQDTLDTPLGRASGVVMGRRWCLSCGAETTLTRPVMGPQFRACRQCRDVAI